MNPPTWSSGPRRARLELGPSLRRRRRDSSGRVGGVVGGIVRTGSTGLDVARDPPARLRWGYVRLTIRRLFPLYLELRGLDNLRKQGQF